MAESQDSYRQHFLGNLLVEDPDVAAVEVRVPQEAESSMQIWKLLPHLDKIPEDYLKTLPISTILSLSNALTKSSKMHEKMSTNAKLAYNASQALQLPTQVKAGQDNRKTILHEGRFLGGACCSNQDLWLQGRSLLPSKGVAALGNYDMDSIGCGGSVTPRGWNEIHNPGSQELKIRLFYLPNVANSSLSAKKVQLDNGEDSLSIGESLKEIADLDGFKGALNTLREAMQTALPWNRSISAISGFMVNTDYLREDLMGNIRRAQILAEFTDYILGRNALNWENGQSFVTSDEMAHIWANWKGKRSALFMTRERIDKDKKMPKFKPNDKVKDICKRFKQEYALNRQTQNARHFSVTS